MQIYVIEIISKFHYSRFIAPDMNSFKTKQIQFFKIAVTYYYIGRTIFNFYNKQIVLNVRKMIPLLHLLSTEKFLILYDLRACRWELNDKWLIIVQYPDCLWVLSAELWIQLDHSMFCLYCYDKQNKFKVVQWNQFRP